MSSYVNDSISSYLFGANANFIESLYEKYLTNPNDIDSKWKTYFDSLQDAGIQDINHSNVQEKFLHYMNNLSINYSHTSNNVDNLTAIQIKVWDLVNNYRILGVEFANLDPLKREEHQKPNFLNIKNFGLEEYLSQEFYLDLNINNAKKYKLSDIINKLEQIYCNTTAFEYSYVTNINEYNWLINAIESVYFEFKLNEKEKIAILNKLTQAEGLEKFLNTKYVGQKRFSVEGGESVIPLLDRLITKSALFNYKELFIGMAHRGRLNVLVNIAGKAPSKLFSEFEDNYKLDDFVISGDVKYHKGSSCNYTTDNGIVKITVPFNPSHLEAINPVVTGMVRATQDKSQKDQVLGVIIHGDSALIGLGTNQGILNMSKTRAYDVNGMIHIVINNQVGFTTSDVRDTRTSRFCTDLAKMIEAPVLHVNADDIERVIFITDLAIAYQQKFKKDIVIDLVCFRRHGHNEADDPTLTQPFMYRKIKDHPGVRTLYANFLIQEGVVTQEVVDNLFENYRISLVSGQHPDQNKMIAIPRYNNLNLELIKTAKAFDKVNTAISKELIQEIADKTTAVPNNFKLHPTIARVVVEPRKQMGQGKLAIDFGMAEILAYGSLIKQGVNVRLVGEDSGRGTFSHRHAVWHNFERETIDDSGYVPLKNLENNSQFSIYDSVLNEECPLGFEYGYSTINFKDLVIWEAQFGDFANGAQVMIDQFVVSSEAKWGVLSNLTLLLPHGYDGQGPEHSSARLERFLQLSAENNIQIVIPSTAAQMFHILRQQAISNYIKPLVIFMSKRLLRAKNAASSIDSFTSGNFLTVIGDFTYTATKVIVCSGQIYYDLITLRTQKKLDSKIAIIRLEQLYPFPLSQLKLELDKYTSKTEVLWVQEEPFNQGAWIQIRDYLNSIVTNIKFEAITRDAAAAPACGSLALHTKQLEKLLESAIR